jgi:hypothetical protein
MLNEITLRPNSPGVISEVLDGEAIIVNLETGAYYSLEGAGAEVWTAAESGATLETVIARVAAGFSSEPTEIAAGVTALVEELIDEGLLVADGAPEDSTELAPPAAAATQTDLPPFVRPVLQKYTDMADLLLLDPIHEVDEQGWPHPAPGA